eukprot:3238076-Amphidinium_carterae.1
MQQRLELGVGKLYLGGCPRFVCARAVRPTGCFHGGGDVDSPSLSAHGGWWWRCRSLHTNLQSNHHPNNGRRKALNNCEVHAEGTVQATSTAGTWSVQLLPGSLSSLSALRITRLSRMVRLMKRFAQGVLT